MQTTDKYHWKSCPWLRQISTPCILSTVTITIPSVIRTWRKWEAPTANYVWGWIFWFCSIINRCVEHGLHMCIFWFCKCQNTLCTARFALAVYDLLFSAASMWRCSGKKSVLKSYTKNRFFLFAVFCLFNFTCYCKILCWLFDLSWDFYIHPDGRQTTFLYPPT